MLLSEFSKMPELKLLTSPMYSDREVSGCYSGDLLSWVMGRAEAGNAWITIMNNINIVAVAVLSGASCIILCEGVGLSEEIVEKADSEDVVIFSTNKTAYEMSCAVGYVL